jgi:hypothetical protein
LGANTKIDSATIRFNNLNNWDNNSNRLFIDLLDTARNNTGALNASNYLSGTQGNRVGTSTQNGFSHQLTAFRDQTNASFPESDMFFNSTPHTDPDWLVDSTTARIALTNREFLGPGQGEVGNLGGGWTGIDAPGTFWHYEYTFSQAQLTTLTQYINNDGVIALGLDPDCHYWNTGVSFTINTSTIPQVPEPATMLLVGTGLALAARRRLKKVA